MAGEKRRRARGDGSVYEDKNGQWWAKVPLGGGRTRRARAQNRSDAEKKRKELVAKRDAGLDIAAADQYVRDYLQGWLVEQAELVKPSTITFYKLCIEYVLPHIGHLRLDALRPAHLQSMLSAVRRDGLSDRTVKHIKSVLRNAFSRAVRRSMMLRNPAELVELPRSSEPATPPAALNPTQIAALLTSVAGHRLAPLYRLAVELGPRRGELLGIRISDFDPDAGTLSLVQQVTAVNGKVDIGTLKNKQSVRVIPLLPRQVEMLKEHVVKRAEEKQLQGDAWQESGLLFCSEVGTAISPRNLTRHFKTALQRAKLPNIRFHDLRHTAATQMELAGIPANVRRLILGHSTAAMSAHYSGHASISDARQALEQADKDAK